jgi:hypothetical protein
MEHDIALEDTPEYAEYMEWLTDRDNNNLPWVSYEEYQKLSEKKP